MKRQESKCKQARESTIQRQRKNGRCWPLPPPPASGGHCWPLVAAAGHRWPPLATAGFHRVKSWALREEVTDV